GRWSTFEAPPSETGSVEMPGPLSTGAQATATPASPARRASGGLEQVEEEHGHREIGAAQGDGPWRGHVRLRASLHYETLTGSVPDSRPVTEASEGRKNEDCGRARNSGAVD